MCAIRAGKAGFLEPKVSENGGLASLQLITYHTQFSVRENEHTTSTFSLRA